MEQAALDLTPFHGFESACREVLVFLHQRTRFALWMVTRTEGEDWIVLQAEGRGHGYDVHDGDVFRWTDSFCSRMVLGLGPRVAPRAQVVPAYAAAPIGQGVSVEAYIGVPLVKRDGSLFGTLCAIDPKPQDDSIRDHLPMVELLARFLGTLLDTDLKRIEQARILERCQEEALIDSMTGLFNRKGWDRALVTEESRARRYGSPACVLIVDLDDLKQVNDSAGHADGDQVIRAAARCIRGQLRESDTVARIGGDEYAVLGIECGALAADNLSRKISGALSAQGIQASVGMAMRDPRRGFAAAVAEADQAMYAAKAERRTQRTGEASPVPSGEFERADDAG